LFTNALYDLCTLGRKEALRLSIRKDARKGSLGQGPIPHVEMNERAAEGGGYANLVRAWMLELGLI
jgi:hypothetical protein